MSSTKKNSARLVHSIPAVERDLAAQIRGEKLHGKKLSRVPKLHRLKFYLAKQRALKKLQKEADKLNAKLNANFTKQQKVCVEIQKSKKQDNEIQDGYLTKAQMQDFRSKK